MTWSVYLAFRHVAVAGASSRNRTGTPPFRQAADFKSAVSTNFTIEAQAAIVKQKRNSPGNDVGGAVNPGGAGRSRTGLDGFAIRCITALLPRRD